MVLQKVDLRDQSGQVLALGALSMLILALMLMLSFNLSEAIHNKIQLQQQADAQAYSMAVVEARTFNYIAYSNRAIAADLVAMATLHAYMSMMSSEVSMLGAAQDNLYVIGVWEIVLCCSCGPPEFCCQLQHCEHAAEAFEKAGKFSQAKSKYGRKLKGLESMFNNSIASLHLMINMIHGSQQWMFYYAALVARGKKLDKIRTFNDPQSSSSLPAAVQALNVEKLACAAQGSPVDWACLGGGGPGIDDRGKLLSEVANATRPKFTASRNIATIYENLVSTFGYDLMRKIQGNGISFPITHSGTAKLVRGQSGLTSSQEGIDAKYVGAEDHGWLMTIFHDGFMAWKYSGDIYSGDKSRKHDPSVAHQGSHSKFKGVHDCLGFSKDCFIKFRANSKAKDHYGQPVVYYYATRDLSKTRKGGHGPWELNKQGKVKMQFGGKSATLTLRAGKGAALSQAMVYYHRMGDWRDAPNFFSPYWRAKLQPLDSTSAGLVLLLTGNTDAATVAVVPTSPVN